MIKIISRYLALLLVGCLIADPVLAAASYRQQSITVRPIAIGIYFQEQALAARVGAVAELRHYDVASRIRSMAIAVWRAIPVSHNMLFSFPAMPPRSNSVGASKETILTSEQIAQYFQKAPFWNWGFAVEMPWRELIRDPVKQPFPDITSENENIYRANHRVVRRAFLRFMSQMAIGQVVSMQEFKEFLSRLNTLLLTATGVYHAPTLKMRSYYPVDASGEKIQDRAIIDAWIKKDIAGRYVNLESPTDRTIKIVLQYLNHFVEQSRLKTTPTELVNTIGNFYKSTMGVVEGGFVNLFLFEQGNNSLFMNLVNAMLRLSNLQGISHGNLDWDSSQFTGDEWIIHNPEFGNTFYRIVQHANPQLSADIVFQSELQVAQSEPAGPSELHSRLQDHAEFGLREERLAALRQINIVSPDGQRIPLMRFINDRIGQVLGPNFNQDNVEIRAFGSFLESDAPSDVDIAVIVKNNAMPRTELSYGGKWKGTVAEWHEGDEVRELPFDAYLVGTDFSALDQSAARALVSLQGIPLSGNIQLFPPSLVQRLRFLELILKWVEVLDPVNPAKALSYLSRWFRLAQLEQDVQVTEHINYFERKKIETRRQGKEIHSGDLTEEIMTAHEILATLKKALVLDELATFDIHSYLTQTQIFLEEVRGFVEKVVEQALIGFRTPYWMLMQAAIQLHLADNNPADLANAQRFYAEHLRILKGHSLDWIKLREEFRIVQEHYLLRSA